MHVTTDLLDEVLLQLAKHLLPVPHHGAVLALHNLEVHVSFDLKWNNYILVR